MRKSRPISRPRAHGQGWRVCHSRPGCALDSPHRRLLFQRGWPAPGPSSRRSSPPSIPPPQTGSCARAKLESLWPGEFHAGSPLPDGRVDFGVVLSGYTNSGFAIASLRFYPDLSRGKLDFQTSESAKSSFLLHCSAFMRRNGAKLLLSGERFFENKALIRFPETPIGTFLLPYWKPSGKPWVCTSDHSCPRQDFCQ